MCSFFLSRRRRPRISTLFPYTTLFRSEIDRVERLVLVEAGKNVACPAGRGIGLRLQALRADLLHHALHRRVDGADRSEEHTSELQSLRHLVCRLLLEKKKTINKRESID